MSQSRQIRSNEPVFITMTVVGWQEVFSRRVYQQIVIDSMLFMIEKKAVRFFAYVLMPNHMHAIIDCVNDRVDLGKVVERTKAFMALRLMDQINELEQEVRKARFNNAFSFYGSRGNHHDRERQFWIHGNHPKTVYSTAFFEQKREYVEMNPVKAGYVDEPHYWRLSSANENSPIPITPF